MSASSEISVFGHYRVLQDEQGRLVKLGEGAMGVTYLAEDEQLKIKVALKVVLPSLLGDEEVARRFQREAQAAARLRHPNVATVFHLGTREDSFFYAMEFVPGETLLSRIQREGRIPLGVALQITLQVCAALSAAEKQGLVHRDIKPANIMLEEDDDQVRVKLIDFGLAKPLITDNQFVTLRTLSGVFLGTPVFASPEQVDDQPLDIRSDFYSLGLTLWFMLEGRLAFEGSMTRVLYAQVHEPPPWKRISHFPKATQELLRRMLEKNPGARPQTSRELRQLITACLDAEALAGSLDANWRAAYRISASSRKYNWGEVYEGEGVATGRVQVQHVLASSFASADAPARLVAEAVKASQVVHPHVLRIHSVFQSEDASGVVLVTEPAAGSSLRDVLKERKELSTGETIDLLRCLASALDSCRSQQLPVPELKPEAVRLIPAAPSSLSSVGMKGAGAPRIVPKVPPFSVEAFLTKTDAEQASSSQVPEEQKTQDMIRRLGLLAYECLGGGETDAGEETPSYVPLQQLTSAQNETLKSCLLREKQFDSAREFVANFSGEAIVKSPAQTTVPAEDPGAGDVTVILPKEMPEQTVKMPEQTVKMTVDEMSVEAPPAPIDRASLGSVVLAPSPQAAADAARPALDPLASMVFQPLAPKEPIAMEPMATERMSGVLPSIVASQQLKLNPGPAAAPLPESFVRESAIYKRNKKREASSHPPAKKTGLLAAVAIIALLAVATGGWLFWKSRPDSTTAKTTETPVAPAKPSETPPDKVADQTPPSNPPTKITEPPAPNPPPAKVVQEAPPAKQPPTKIVEQAPPPNPPAKVVESTPPAKPPEKVVEQMPPAKPPEKVVEQPPPAKVAEQMPPPLPKIVEPPKPIEPPPPTAQELLQATQKALAGKNTSSLKSAMEALLGKVSSPTALGEMPGAKDLFAAVAVRYQNGDLGARPAALATWEKALRIGAAMNVPEALGSLGEDLLPTQPKEAATFAEQGLRLSSRDLAPQDLITSALHVAEKHAGTPAADFARELLNGQFEPLLKYPPDSEALVGLHPLMEKSASLDVVPALAFLGNEALEKREPAQAIKYLRRASELGDPPSMNKLGLVLADKELNYPPDLKAAADWFAKAEAADYAPARFTLGECYLFGKGVARDPARAFSLLQNAADARVPEACYLLGSSLLNSKAGDFAPQLVGNARLKRSRELLERALELGDQRALAELAFMNMQGLGTARNIAEGFRLIQQGAKASKPVTACVRLYAAILAGESPLTGAELKELKITPNPLEAEKLFVQAARLGDEMARDWCLSNKVSY